MVWINLAYVIPEHRREGVHSTMFAALIKKARELKRRQIGSGTSLKNIASRAMMKAQGRVEKDITTIFVIPPDEHERGGHG